MDRTIIAPYRAEEKELSQILHKKLQGLALLHPMSEELRKLLSDEMFVKPNQQAFFHAMHYLFRLIDHNEFKKRFFWPITDKKSESIFRSSTIEYLKFLNEKHHLNWTSIKSYLVVMPGGMKFISFMLDFIHFIIRELIKQKEKSLNLDTSQQEGILSEINIQKMCKKDVLFKEMASGFIESIDAINKSRKIKIDVMTQHLEELAETTGMAFEQFTDDTFQSSFEDSNSKLFKRQLGDRADKVCGTEKQVHALKNNMDAFYSKDAGFKCDKNKLRTQLLQLHEELSLSNITDDTKTSDKAITLCSLIRTFNGIIETIQHELVTIDKRPRAGIVHTRLIDIQQDLKDVEMQITKFLMSIKSKGKKRQDLNLRTPVRSNVLIETNFSDVGCSKRILENALTIKYVATPPIKLENTSGTHGPSRLSLIDAKMTGITTSTFASFLAPPRNLCHTKLNASAAEQSIIHFNSTANRSKLIDPMQLLRSINKDTSKMIVTTPRSNISSLGSKWKERQILFMNKENELAATPVTADSDYNTTPMLQSSALKSSLSRSLFTEKDADISSTSTLVKKSFGNCGSFTMFQSPTTPFTSNERTRINRSQLQLLETNLLTGNTGIFNQSTSSSWSTVKKLSAVKKVQDASLYFANLSTSPSGRLEPLVTAEDFNIPKIKLNDISLMDHNITSDKPIVSGCNLNISTREARCAIESNDKIIKIQRDEDALCNISDSILKDVTM